MKYYFLLLFLLLPEMAFTQNSHHVYSGEVPWINSEVTREEGKIYSISEAIQKASAGDSIIVHEGIYREMVSVDKDHIILRNYQNDYVLVTGAEVVTGWYQSPEMAEGIYEADISGFDIETDYTQFPPIHADLWLTGTSQTIFL